VSEQDELLKMLWRSAGVVTQAREAEVRARPVEQSERPWLVGRADPDSVGDLVAQMHQLVGRKVARQLGSADVAHLDAAILDHIGVWDFARRAADRHGHVIIAREMLELIYEIVAEQFGPSDAGRVGAGLVEAGESARRRRGGDLPAIVD